MIVSNKRCTRCNKELPEDSFSPVKRNSGGEVIVRNSWCKVCKLEVEREARRNRGVKPRRILFTDHVNGLKECGECGEVMEILHFSPSERGSLGVSSYCKCCSTTRGCLPDDEKRRRAREATQRYRDKHRERWRAMHRVHQFNRKSLIKATDEGTVTDDFLERLFNKERCCWCNKVMDEGEKTIEHVVELSNGGKHSASNIDLACLSCNSARKNKGKVNNE